MNHPSISCAGAVRLWLLAAVLPILAGCMNIHKAANNGDLAGVKQFLQKGVAVDARDSYGRTPLMLSLSNLESVRYLVGKGADVNARDAQGETPLMKAAFLGKVDVVRYLVEHGADVNARSEKGETPLMRAIWDLDVIQFLVERGADINAADRKGETLLLKAAVSGRLSTVQYLVKAGATVDAGAQGGAAPRRGRRGWNTRPRSTSGAQFPLGAFRLGGYPVFRHRTMNHTASKMATAG